MNASAIFFYILSICILGGGLLAVTSKKIFRSAIWLLFSLIGIAGLYFWMQMEFIAAVRNSRVNKWPGHPQDESFSLYSQFVLVLPLRTVYFGHMYSLGPPWHL